MEIVYILATAYAGFRAAVLESGRIASSGAPVVVHTGFWGCGAFGGNRVVMTTLQAIAGQMAGVDRIILHTSAGAFAGADAIVESRRTIEKDLAIDSPAVELRSLIQRISALGLSWAAGDGN